MSGCIDHFAALEPEAYECTRNIISTLNFELPEEDSTEIEEPLYKAEELMGLAPRSYNFSIDVKLVRFIFEHKHIDLAEKKHVSHKYSLSAFTCLDCESAD